MREPCEERKARRLHPPHPTDKKKAGITSKEAIPAWLVTPVRLELTTQ